MESSPPLLAAQSMVGPFRHEMVLFYGVEPHEIAIACRSEWSSVRNFISSTYNLTPNLLGPIYSFALVLPSEQDHARFCLAFDQSPSNI